MVGQKSQKGVNVNIREITFGESPANKKERTEVLSLWTSLGLKFVTMMQLIERMFAVALGGANVYVREITFGKSPDQL